MTQMSRLAFLPGLLVVCCFLAPPGLAISNNFQSPASLDWFANATVPISGNASDPSPDAFAIDSSAAFGNGTFNGTGVTAGGALGLQPRNWTTIRYFSNFSYPPSFDIRGFEDAWAAGLGVWSPSSSLSARLPDPPALIGDPGGWIFWHGISPQPIREAWLKAHPDRRVLRLASCYLQTYRARQSAVVV